MNLRPGPVFLSLLLLIYLLSSCSERHHFVQLEQPFQITSTAPDYGKTTSWAALPEMQDNADRVPKHSREKDGQADARVDVFFIHPTTYLHPTKTSTGWNADINDSEVNERTDRTTILYQASVFNAAGRIYAPRYRQAHISSYFSRRKDDAKQAFELAYSDIKLAFDYYLAHYNQGRPLIIASHSQGTTHAMRLLQDYFDGKPLANQLVAAYLVGMPVNDTIYTELRPCRDSTQTGCYVSWRTFSRDYYPPGILPPDLPPVCTNPLTWTGDTVYAPRSLNMGGVLKNFNHITKRLSDAKIDPFYGIVRIRKPHFFGNVFFHYKNYHIVDYNLFYLNIRRNAETRIESFLKK